MRSVAYVFMLVALVTMEVVLSEVTPVTNTTTTHKHNKHFSPLTDISYDSNHHARCTHTDGSSSDSIILELYEGIPGHGDVCRDPNTGGFYCPKGCFPSSKPPYCVEKKLGFAATACRVNSRINGLRGVKTISNNNNNGTRIVISNLPRGVSEKDIYDMFQSAGNVIAATLIADSNGKPTGKAQVVYANHASAMRAVTLYNGKHLANNQVTVSMDTAHSPFTQVTTYRKQTASNQPIPIFASPIMMFHPETGLPYLPGEAPSIWSLLFPSLTSARWVDPDVDIYVITNFIPHMTDMAELNRLKIKVLDMDDCFSYGRVKDMYRLFTDSCPISGKDLGGSGIIGVTRFYALQGAMEMLGLDMVFFLEGDNLLLRPIEYLNKAYKIRENKIDATITHISFHASFISLEFLEQLNNQANLFAEFTKKYITNECFLTGGGQDMRLGYEGARMLQIQKLMFNHLQGMDADVDENDARILNTAGGTVPCELKPRRWNNALGEYCKATGELVGPCALEENLGKFNLNNGEMWTADDKKYEPLLYECAPSSMEPSLTNDIDKIPGSLQQNLKGSNVKQSPGSCKKQADGGEEDEELLCQGGFSDNVHISHTFYCDEDWVKSDPENQNNKALSFKYGRAYSLTLPSGHWIEHYNLHFQGGGCKKQMEIVFSALKRSYEMAGKGFTCEETTNLEEHEECMRTGLGETQSMNDFIKYN